MLLDAQDGDSTAGGKEAEDNDPGAFGELRPWAPCYVLSVYVCSLSNLVYLVLCVFSVCFVAI